MGAWSISAPPFKTFQGLDHPGRRPGRQQGRCAQTGKNGIQNIIANNCGRGQSVNTRPSGKGNPTHTHKTTRAARSHTNSHTSGHFGDWSRSTWWEFRIEQKTIFTMAVKRRPFLTRAPMPSTLPRSAITAPRRRSHSCALDARLSPTVGLFGAHSTPKMGRPCNKDYRLSETHTQTRM